MELSRALEYDNAGSESDLMPVTSQSTAKAVSERCLHLRMFAANEKVFKLFF